MVLNSGWYVLCDTSPRCTVIMVQPFAYVHINLLWRKKKEFHLISIPFSQFFRKFHAAYVDAVSNPFHVPGKKIASRSFGARVSTIVKSFGSGTTAWVPLVPNPPFNQALYRSPLLTIHFWISILSPVCMLNKMIIWQWKQKRKRKYGLVQRLFAPFLHSVLLFFILWCLLPLSLCMGCLLSPAAPISS